MLTKKLSADAFERLIQRLLRESGFIQVEVTGRSGDGGIDGKGIARIHGFINFHVVFQCKKWQGVVPSNEIRDFRGALTLVARELMLEDSGSMPALTRIHTLPSTPSALMQAREHSETIPSPEPRIQLG